MRGESVVIPAATARSSVALHRSLGRRGIRTIAAADESAPSFRSRYCDETVLVPSPATDSDGYGEALQSLARRPDVLTIAPMRELDVYLLARHRSELSPHVATPWPSFETLQTVHDRELLFEAARDAGVPVPETRLLSSVDDWAGEHVVKPRYAFLAEEYVSDRSGGGTPDSASARFLEADDRPDPAALRSGFGHDPHVQQYVRGPEYSFAAMYDEGDVVATAQKRIIRGEKYYCGPSVYHEQVDIPELETVGTGLLDHLEWHGPADVDIVRDRETGEFKLLEVNPRFWSTVSNEIRAGVDFPYYFWRLARGRPVHETVASAVGERSHYLPGELSYLQSVLAEDNPLCATPPVAATVWAIAASLLRRPAFDLLDLGDPRPFVRDVLDNVQSLRADR